MNNLPYFFALLKNNVILWTIITTASFSKIDLKSIDHIQATPHYLSLTKYSLAKDENFIDMDVVISETGTSIRFETDSDKYWKKSMLYFGSDPKPDKIQYAGSGYDSLKFANNVVLDGNQPAYATLKKSNDNKFAVEITIYRKNFDEIFKRRVDSLKKADSIKNLTPTKQ